MNTFALIIQAENTDQAYEKTIKAVKRYSNHNITSCINFNEDKDLFDETSKTMIDYYNNLKETTKNLIIKFEGKVKKDDYILNQMKDNLKRYQEKSYSFPEEWKIVYFDGKDFNHIDDVEYYNKIIKEINNNKLFIALIDIP